MVSLQETTMKMGIDKKSARFVGVLFLTAMVASLLGGGIVESIISSSNYLAAASESKPQLLIGVLLELINGIAVVGIAVLMFPILKRINTSMAIGYLCFRIIEALFCCLIVISPLSLITLSKEYLKTGALDTDYFQAAAVLSVAERASITGLLIPIFFCFGALLFYYLLYKSKLLPQFISVWGIIAVILIITMNLFTIFQAGSLNTGMLMVLAFPIILNEIFLGIWLIFKGFNSSYNTSMSA